MALSAVIQKHTVSLPSSITSSNSCSLPAAYVQNIVVQPPLTPSPSTPSPELQQHNSSSAAAVAQRGLIAVTSAGTKASNMNTLPFLTQGVSGAAAQLYGTPIALQQFATGQESGTAVSASAAGTPIVQLAPVGYASAQGDNRAALFQQAGVIGYVILTVYTLFCLANQLELPKLLSFFRKDWIRSFLSFLENVVLCSSYVFIICHMHVRGLFGLVRTSPLC